MLSTLLGALLVMAAGMAAVTAIVRWGTRDRAVRTPPPEEPAPPEEPTGVGGYWPFPGGISAEGQQPVLPPPTVARVRALLGEGRQAEAVEEVRTATGMDLYRAQETVALIRRNQAG